MVHLNGEQFWSLHRYYQSQSFLLELGINLRYWILFLTFSSTIVAELNSTLANGTVSERICRQWVLQFNEGKFDLEDSDRYGRPSLDMDDTINQQFAENYYSTCRFIVMELSACHKLFKIPQTIGQDLLM